MCKLKRVSILILFCVIGCSYSTSPLVTLQLPENNINDVRILWSPDDSYILFKSYHGIYLYKTEQWELIPLPINEEAFVDDVAWSPDSRKIILLGDHHRVRIFNINSTEAVAEIDNNNHETGNLFGHIDWLDTNTILTSERLSFGILLEAYDGASLDLLWSKTINTHVWSIQNHKLAFSTRTGVVDIFDIINQINIKELKSQAGRISFIAWSPSGKKLAVSSEKEIVIWNVETGQIDSALKRPHRYMMKWVSDNTLLVDDNGGVISVWDVDTVTLIRQIRIGPIGWTGTLTWYARDNYLISFYQQMDDSFGEVSVWNIINGTLIMKITSMQSAGNINNRGDLLATININGELQIWNISQLGPYVKSGTPMP